MKNIKTNIGMYPKPQLKIEVFKDKKRVLMIFTTNKPLFLSKLKKIKKFKNAKYLLTVKYGTIIDVFNNRVEAINQGEYYNLKDLLFALKIFTDPREIGSIYPIVKYDNQ